MSKYCKKCWILNENPLSPLCKEHYFEREKSKPVKIYEIKKTPVKLIWKKRAERIKKDWSEMKVFIEIWKDRIHICDNCWKSIKFFHSSCFAHKLNKRDNPKLRYDKNNIALVHGIFEIKNEETWLTYDCHKEYDLKLKEIIKKL